MKTIVILGDGMADYPIAALGGRTPLMAANTPNMDRLAALGKNGRLVTVPDDLPAGSEVANLAVLGYDVHKVYNGRGVLEAAASGVHVAPDDLAMRCNLLCLENDRIKNHSAGHISTEEARQLIDSLNARLSRDGLRFYPGVSYRHLLLLRNGNPGVRLTPPHDVPGTPWRDVLPTAANPEGSDTSAILTELILQSHAILENHPVNIQRRNRGKDPANSVWFWSAGKRPEMSTFQDLYGITGAVISAVDLLHGIGVYAGLEVIHVEGATGLWDTNYAGKTAAALEAIRSVDFVYLHIEAPDEAGHEGNANLKVRCIEDLDSKVVGPVLDAALEADEPFTVALLPDHPTPCEVRTHTYDPIPFAIFHKDNVPDSVTQYDEESAKAGAYGLINGPGFFRLLYP